MQYRQLTSFTMGKTRDEELAKGASVEQMSMSREDSLLAEAEESRVIAHGLTRWQAIKVYPNALFWCFMVSMCVIMEGTCHLLSKPLRPYLNRSPRL